MTPDEWRTWKKHSVNRSIAMQRVSRDTAKAMRDRYLREQTPFDTNNYPEVCDAWDDMINYRLRWADTPEGHSHWERVCMRTAPVRNLPPLTIVINTVN
jgi:hypothetical protein